MKSIILELCANALDIAVLTFLFCKRLPRKYESFLPTVIFVLAGFFLECVPVFWSPSFYPMEIILLSACFIYTCFRGGTWLHKIFWVSVSFVTILALALTISPILSMVTGISVKELNNVSNFAGRALYLASANIVKIIVFYIIAKNPRKTQFNRVTMLLCLFIPVISLVFGNLVHRVYVYKYSFVPIDGLILLFAGSYLLISVVSIVLYEIIEKDSEKMVYLLARENQYATMSRYTEQIGNMNSDIQTWQHDMKQHLGCLNTLIEQNDIDGAKDYLARLTDKAKLSYMKINSGNYIADAVLSSKIRIATEKGIKVDCSASLPDNLLIDDVDFCSILSNTLENAIEAAEKVVESPYINCDVITIKNQLVIEIENSSTGKYKCRGGVYESIKSGGIHGIGLRQVQSIVDKYEGFCSIDAGKDRFKISISIPVGGR